MHGQKNIKLNSWWWTDELSETCRVSWQNIFVKLVHLGGFYYKEICYDARSHERKILQIFLRFENHKDDVENEKKELWFYWWLICGSVLLPATGIWLKLTVFIWDSSIYGSKAVRSFKFSYNLRFAIIEEFNIHSVCNFSTFLAWIINYDYNSASNMCKTLAFCVVTLIIEMNFFWKTFAVFREEFLESGTYWVPILF